MRARNIKPGYFKNELLGKADPLIGTLFQGLWCMADREGRLEDRPLRMAAEVFPYRRAVTEKKVDGYLDWLHAHQFIVRYEVDGNRFIQILEFLRHQHPHKSEAQSRIQGLNAIPNGAYTGEAPDDTVGPTGVARLNPSSLNPSSLNPESPLTGVRTKNGAPPGSVGPSSPGRKKTAKEIEELARSQGLDIFALPGEPGYCGDRKWE